MPTISGGGTLSGFTYTPEPPPSLPGSLLFNGSNYLTVPANTAFAFAKADLTVEMWIYPTATITTPANIGLFYVEETNGLVVGLSSGYLAMGRRTVAYDLTSSYIPPLNTWTHIAVTRSGATAWIFANGVQVGTVTASAGDANNNANYVCTTGLPTIAGNYAGGAGFGYFPGHISNLRVVKGTALYTENFTPSTAPLTAIANTSLLLNAFQGANFLKDTSTNNFTVTNNNGVTSSNVSPVTVEYLVVAGGGGGGSGRSAGSYASGGGGGAGGFRTNAGASGGGSSSESAIIVARGTTYTVTVGAGGAAGVAGFDNAANGTNSVFSTITSIGGGGGAAWNFNTVGNSGGSGGGGYASGGAGTANQGYAGGSGQTPATGGQYGGGGGGGAGAIGILGTGSAGGNGGSGVISSISGSSVTYAGGGGGGVYNTGTPGLGGSGGGANGGPNTSGGGDGSGLAASENTGGGGGGASRGTISGATSIGGAGGSGIVFVRYPDTYAVATSTTGSPNVIYANANIIYRFWQSGTITF